MFKTTVVLPNWFHVQVKNCLLRMQTCSAGHMVKLSVVKYVKCARRRMQFKKRIRREVNKNLLFGKAMFILN